MISMEVFFSCRENFLLTLSNDMAVALSGGQFPPKGHLQYLEAFLSRISCSQGWLPIHHVAEVGLER